MMHHNSITIALTDENKKPYREYGFKKLSDKCKTSEVILPFDSHYQILAKNDNSQRIRLDIDIDGTIITGSGLIINGNSQAYIERFVESAKKLLFVKKTDDKVSDPTNAENGFLTIKVSKEKAAVWHVLNSVWKWPTHPDLPGYDYYSNRFDYDYATRYLVDPGHRPPSSWGTVPVSVSGNDLKLSGGIRSMSSSIPASFSGRKSVSEPSESVNCFFSSAGSAMETGATVEGDKSNQSFTTTSWNGEEIGSDYIFRFKMLGKETKLSVQEEKDLMEYKRLKAKFEGV